jgi:hypothetical protein
MDNPKQLSFKNVEPKLGFEVPDSSATKEGNDIDARWETAIFLGKNLEDIEKEKETGSRKA